MARRKGSAGTAAAPPEARRYPDEIAGRCQSRPGDCIQAPGLPQAHPAPLEEGRPCGRPRAHPLSAGYRPRPATRMPDRLRGVWGNFPKPTGGRIRPRAGGGRARRQRSRAKSRGTQPSPPAICGRGRREHRRARLTCVAGSRAFSGGAGGRLGRRPPPAPRCAPAVAATNVVRSLSRPPSPPAILRARGAATEAALSPPAILRACAAGGLCFRLRGTERTAKRPP